MKHKSPLPECKTFASLFQAVFLLLNTIPPLLPELERSFTGLSYLRFLWLGKTANCKNSCTLKLTFPAKRHLAQMATLEIDQFKLKNTL